MKIFVVNKTQSFEQLWNNLKLIFFEPQTLKTLKYSTNTNLYDLLQHIVVRITHLERYTGTDYSSLKHTKFTGLHLKAVRNSRDS